MGLKAPIALLVAACALWCSVRASARIDLVGNAADPATRAAAPGSLASIFGEGLASGTAGATGYPLPVKLASTSVEVDGIAAPLLYVSPTQINFQVPFEVTGPQATVSVTNPDGSRVSTAMTVNATSPGIFSMLGNGTGPAAVQHVDGRLVSRADPVSADEWVQIYATGLGKVDGAIPSGAASPASPPLRVAAPVRVFFDQVEADVWFAGLAPGFAGLNQINAKVPAGLASNYPKIVVEAGGERTTAELTVGGPGISGVEPAVVGAGSNVTLSMQAMNAAPGSFLEIAEGRIPVTIDDGLLQRVRAKVPGAAIVSAGRVELSLQNGDGDPNSRSNRLELEVAPAAPLTVSRSELSFLASCDAPVANEALTVASAGQGAIEWTTATSGEPWLSVSAAEGITPHELTITAKADGLTPGLYEGSVMIASSLESKQVAVRLTVSADDAPPAVGAPNVYVLDSLRRVKQNDALPVSPATSASLFAARGEYEAFQIIVHGGSDGLQEVSAGLSRPLRSATCATLAAGNVRFYREHYIRIDLPSNRGAGGAQPGIYPDALIPFVNPYTGEPLRGGTYPAAPFDVGAGTNQPVYVEVYVPETAAAGVYKGTITVTGRGGLTVAEVPVTLTVWDIDIPKTPSLRTAFQSYDAEHLIGAGGYYGYQYGSEELQSVAVALDQTLLAHRVVPEAGKDFEVGENGALVRDPAREALIEQIARQPERSVLQLDFTGSYPFDDPLGRDRAAAIRYLREAYQWFAARGLQNKIFVRSHDEPLTDADFQQVRAFADLVHEANPELKVAITGYFEQKQFQQYLYGALDIFVMGWESFDPVIAAQRRALDDEMWTYTALVQYTDNPSPYWQIDFPLLNYRVIPWICFRYSLRGLLYWTSVMWDETRARGRSPWTDPCSATDGECFNGEGMLVYPGKEVNLIVPKDAYGQLSSTPVYGPVASLRLKALRDGMEDYELLTLASQKSPAEAMSASVLVGCAGDPNPGDARRNCFHAWNKDPDSIARVRAELAAVITRSF